MIMNYEKTNGFERDLLKMQKKFASLQDDLEIVKQYGIELLHFSGIDKQGIFKIENVGTTEELQFYKIKKFACRSLKGRGNKSGIRIIYAYFPEKRKIVFLEIYFKAKQEKENRSKIKKFIESEK